MTCVKHPDSDLSPKGRCRACNSEYQAKWYAANKEKQKQRVQENNDRYRLERRQFLYNYLSSHPCVGCGEDDPIVLEFDHIDPKEKYMAISAMVRDNHSIKSIEAEIAKCQVLCANCHRRRTAEQFDWYDSVRRQGVEPS